MLFLPDDLPDGLRDYLPDRSLAHFSKAYAKPAASATP
jgi:hypothetical protein